MHNETNKRSFVKTVTYRVLIVITNAVIVFLITHRYDVTAWVVIVTNIANTLLYFFHERFWSGINWGITTPDIPEK